MGRGGSQQHRQWYNRPTRTGSVVKQLGEGDHLNRLKAEKLLLAEVDSDHWKTLGPTSDIRVHSTTNHAALNFGSFLAKSKPYWFGRISESLR